MDIIKVLEEYIIDELRYSDHKQESIDPAENLIANGTIDSLGILKLTGFIENSFNIQITDEDITKENFQSINTIKWFIEKKLNLQKSWEQTSWSLFRLTSKQIYFKKIFFTLNAIQPQSWDFKWLW